MIDTKEVAWYSQASEVTPPCPHFGPCGGCQLQHLTYPSQLAAKRSTLEALLHEANIPNVPAIQTHTADPWHYRNRIRIRVEPGPGNTFLVGYNRHASNEFLPIRTCPIAAPVLLHTAQTLSTLALTNPPSPSGSRPPPNSSSSPPRTRPAFNSPFSSSPSPIFPPIRSPAPSPSSAMLSTSNFRSSPEPAPIFSVPFVPTPLNSSPAGV